MIRLDTCIVLSLLIRQAHQTVLVDGKALAQLGKIVESKRLLEDPAHAVP